MIRTYVRYLAARRITQLARSLKTKDCDLDHNERWIDGGPTCECNLHPLCRYHHQIKDTIGWQYETLPDGDYLWTTRLGHTYTTSGRSP